MVEKELLKNGLETPLKSICGFSVSGCPIWVFKGVADQAKERFNDTYWMRIAELLQIEAAYFDLTESLRIQRELVEASTIPPQARSKEPEAEKKTLYLGQR